MEEMTMEKMTNLCKQYGYIYQGSEIYGGLANTWDYGPLGAKLKNNVKDSWRNFYIRRRYFNESQSLGSIRSRFII